MLVLDVAALSYVIDWELPGAKSAKCLLFLPLIGLFVLLLGQLFRLGALAKRSAKNKSGQGNSHGSSDMSTRELSHQDDEREHLRGPG